MRYNHAYVYPGYPPIPPKPKKRKDLKIDEIREIAKAWEDVKKTAEAEAMKKIEVEKKASLSVLDCMLLFTVLSIPFAALEIYSIRIAIVMLKEMLKNVN